MSENRLNKIIKEYKVGLQRLAEFLGSKDATVEENPDVNMQDEHLPLTERQFGGEVHIKEVSETVDINHSGILVESIHDQSVSDVDEYINVDDSSGNSIEVSKIRLNKIMRRYNIGLHALVDFLRSHGVDVDEHPAAKVSEEHLLAIERHFRKDSVIKEQSQDDSGR